MKNLGHVRIDEVGRIVIPKEIRKVLRLDESRLLEIYTEKDKLILRRYSPLFNNYEFVKKIITKMAEHMGCECIIGSKDKVIAVSSDSLKGLENKGLTHDFVEIMHKSSPYILNMDEGGKPVDIVKEMKIEYNSLALVTIESECEKIGFICIMGFEPQCILTGENLQIMRIASCLISSAIES